MKLTIAIVLLSACCFRQGPMPGCCYGPVDTHAYSGGPACPHGYEYFEDKNGGTGCRLTKTPDPTPTPWEIRAVAGGPMVPGEENIGGHSNAVPMPTPAKKCNPELQAAYERQNSHDWPPNTICDDGTVANLWYYNDSTLEVCGKHGSGGTKFLRSGERWVTTKTGKYWEVRITPIYKPWSWYYPPRCERKKEEASPFYFDDSSRDTTPYYLSAYGTASYTIQEGAPPCKQEPGKVTFCPNSGQILFRADEFHEHAIYPQHYMDRLHIPLEAWNCEDRITEIYCERKDTK